jgi:hypothetical protein
MGVLLPDIRMSSVAAASFGPSSALTCLNACAVARGAPCRRSRRSP